MSSLRTKPQSSSPRVSITRQAANDAGRDNVQKSMLFGFCRLAMSRALSCMSPKVISNEVGLCLEHSTSVQRLTRASPFPNTGVPEGGWRERLCTWVKALGRTCPRLKSKVFSTFGAWRDTLSCPNSTESLWPPRRS
jgi:hypothetical protein